MLKYWIWVRFDSDSIPIRFRFESASNPVGFRPKLTLNEATIRSTIDRPETDSRLQFREISQKAQF